MNPEFPVGRSKRLLLNLGGQPLTLACMALIATTLERDGCIEITNCATTECLGLSALTLGMAMAEKVNELREKK